MSVHGRKSLKNQRNLRVKRYPVLLAVLALMLQISMPVLHAAPMGASMALSMAGEVDMDRMVHCPTMRAHHSPEEMRAHAEKAALSDEMALSDHPMDHPMPSQSMMDCSLCQTVKSSVSLPVASVLILDQLLPEVSLRHGETHILPRGHSQLASLSRAPPVLL